MLNKTLLGIPTYDGRVHVGVLGAILRLPKPPMIEFSISSLLANSFNRLWCTALNLRSSGLTHFCMLHADVEPTEPDWLPKLHYLAQKYQADVISAVIPIKDPAKRITSTAMMTAHGPRNITCDEALNSPATFTNSKLLLNTGLMLVDLSKPWVEEIHFEIQDHIVREGDHFVSTCLSEDWAFSIQAREMGAKLFATREIAVKHWGTAAYSLES